MNPIYKFQLSAGNDTRQAFPVYKDDLAIDYALEQNQEFYRGKLSGKLTFQKDDYLFIRSKAFDTQFDVVISISYNGGQTWAVYWSGQFWKTDCKFNEDDQTAIVTPNVNDRYNAVLAGMDKEYNLIDLAPVIQPVKADKRPMVQVYVPGQTVIGCFLSGMWWEQECTPVNETDTIEIEGQTINKLAWLSFSLNKTMRIAEVSGTFAPELPNFFTLVRDSGERIGEFFEMTDGGYRFIYEDLGGAETRFAIARLSSGETLWERVSGHYGMPPYTVTLDPVVGSGVSGNVTLYVHDISVYARYVCDTLQVAGLNTIPIPADDMVENNRNYGRMIGYFFPDTIYFSTLLTSTPTQWGLYQPGQYYQQPYLYWNPELFPIARNAWGRISVWFAFSAIDWLVESSGRQPFTIRHAYPLSSVISVLLAKIAPGITHAGTTDYSQFLYGTNLIGITQTLLITPKSNLVTAGYDQPAQKAPITLKNVLDMLRDCFRCYWFIDDQNRFRVEHIQYFRNGGSYSGSPVVGIDLTTQKVPRNGKEWAFARNQYKFDKPEMAARYQFGWMDDVTQLFEGFPIDIISKYVNPDNIEQIDVSKFTSDIDYILLNPGEISKDGFVLLGANYVFEDLPHTINGWLNRNTGGANSSADYERTDYVTVTPGAKIKYSGSVIGNAGAVMGYDADKNFVSALLGWGSYTNFEITIPDGVYFIRACGLINGQTVDFSVSYCPGLSLPYMNYQIDENDHVLQNAYVAFCILQQYYAFDMPAPQYEINGKTMYAYGIKKLKNQTLRFPVLDDPNLVQLVKTNLGDGTIEKLSVNLSSRNANATLKYDTE